MKEAYKGALGLMLVFALVGGLMGMGMIGRAARFEERRDKYRRRRREFVRELRGR